MSEIRIKSSYVIDTGSKLSSSIQRLANTESGISALRNSIDGRVISRSAIGAKFNRAKRDIDKLKNEIGDLQKFIFKSVDDYRSCENYLEKRAKVITSVNSKNSKTMSLNKAAFTQEKEKDKMNKKDMKDAKLEMAGFDWMAPIAGTNAFGTLTGAGVTGHVYYRATKGYEVLRSKEDKKIKITEDGRPIHRKKTPKGRPRAKYNIYDESYIKSQMKRGNYVKASEFVNAKGAAVAAAKDKLGWISVGLDVGFDTYENVKSGASGSKITGDILGNVAVGVGTAVAATAITIAALPAAASVATVAAVGFGLSVIFTYATEGLKWNVDSDKDGENDSIKDMVKAGFGKASSTVAGWFNGNSKYR